MKSFTRLLLLAVSLCCTTAVFANTLIIKGTVKTTDNKPVANKKIQIILDSSHNNSCALVHTVLTNPNGYYIDTITCSGTIKKIKITTEDCNGKLLVNEPPLTTSSNIIESNFKLCEPGISNPTHCKAQFRFEIKDLWVKLNSRSADSLNADSIVSRIWDFGDGIKITGNRIDPDHAFSKPGIYNICLMIKTKRGCESKTCLSVVIPETRTTCSTHVSSEKIGAKKFRFSSIKSSGAIGDSIVQRKWHFGDGTYLEGNEINPLKEYKDTGVYNVCLKIKTKKGCESDYCLKVIIRDSIHLTPTPINCKSYFDIRPDGKRIAFNSKYAAASEGDSIISRTWSFGDSSTLLTGNRLDPVHEFAKPGTYTVCLLIKTKKGCESKFCKTIEIKSLPPVPVTCHAKFEYEQNQFTIRFISKASEVIKEDSIISRTWSFGDSTQKLMGNSVDPSHTYSKPGVYYVCLTIKTKKGCESSYCTKVTVKQRENCKADFSLERIAGSTKIKFSSKLSKIPEGDSIIERRWKFGDGTDMRTGNVADTTKAYPHRGIYTACLQIVTAKGCESTICKPVLLIDSLYIPGANATSIKIVRINPNPITTRMFATVWSKQEQTPVELSIFDIYGVKKWTMKKVLTKGDNVIEIPTAALATGPYFLHVSAGTSRDSRIFYKF